MTNGKNKPELWGLVESAQKTDSLENLTALPSGILPGDNGDWRWKNLIGSLREYENSITKLLVHRKVRVSVNINTKIQTLIIRATALGSVYLYTFNYIALF